MDSLIPVTVNGQPTQLPANSTISLLLDHLKINSRAIAVEINQEIQSADRFSAVSLKPNDEIEVVTLVGGG